MSICEVSFGENLAKVELPRSGWTYHHDEINHKIHMIIRPSGMVSYLEIEDYLIRKLQGMKVTYAESVPRLNKHLMGYVLVLRQQG